MTEPQINRYRILENPAGVYRHPGLGRHVNHDARSRRYPFRTGLATLTATFHERHVPIFDQGDLGSCTGNAGLGILATGPYWADLSAEQQTHGLAGRRYTWDEDGAKQLYSDLTADDGFDGEWPPDDTGSDGLTVGKEFVKRGVLPGYQHTFDLNGALAALMKFPLLVGTQWLDNMFNPDSSGRIIASGPVDGGHEWIVDEYVPANGVSHAGNVLGSAACVGGTTSWGTSFGVSGRFYLKVSDFGHLLVADGDVMVLTPPTAPAPTPDPEPTPGFPTAQSVADGVRGYLTGLGL